MGRFADHFVPFACQSRWRGSPRLPRGRRRTAVPAARCRGGSGSPRRFPTDLFRGERPRFLAEMEQVVPWARLVPRLQPHYPKGERGRRPIGLERMRRIYFLQQWYGLERFSVRLHSRLCDPEPRHERAGAARIRVHLRVLAAIMAGRSKEQTASPPAQPPLTYRSRLRDRASKLTAARPPSSSGGLPCAASARPWRRCRGRP